jgi:membrane-bound metal-dependent hydrolase YbcI (DUF457 family)
MRAKMWLGIAVAVASFVLLGLLSVHETQPAWPPTWPWTAIFLGSLFGLCAGTSYALKARRG